LERRVTEKGRKERELTPSSKDTVRRQAGETLKEVSLTTQAMHKAYKNTPHKKWKGGK